MRSGNFSLEDMISSVSLNTGGAWSQLLVLSKRTNTSLDQFRSVRHEAFHIGFCVLFCLLSPFSEDMSSRENMLELHMWNAIFAFQNYFQDLSLTFKYYKDQYTQMRNWPCFQMSGFWLVKRKTRKTKLDFCLHFPSSPLISGVDKYFFLKWEQ